MALKENKVTKDWQNIIMGFSNSKMTDKGYCKQKDIALSTFYKYRRVVKNQKLFDKPLFLPVKVEDSFKTQLVNNQKCIEIMLNDQFKIRIPNDEVSMSNLIEALVKF